MRLAGRTVEIPDSGRAAAAQVRRGATALGTRAAGAAPVAALRQRLGRTGGRSSGERYPVPSAADPTGTAATKPADAADDGWAPEWTTDNRPSRRWPLYTRGNIGEVFPEVVLPLTWQSFGGAAERGWRQAFIDLGTLTPQDIDADEDMVVVGVFGGYAYINVGLCRLLGVRAPGGSVEVVDQMIFGESDAPAYVARPGDRNLRATLTLGRNVLRLLGTRDLPALAVDKADAAAYLERFPGEHGTDEALLDYLFELEPIFERLFARHLTNTFSVALVSGVLSDLCVKAGQADKLVSVLAGIGDVESAAPSAAMWRLARVAQAHPAVAAGFDAGVDGLLERLRADPDACAWVDQFGGFLEEFGSRGPNEWDLGSDPWALRPELALAAIDRMRHADAAHDPQRQAEALRRRREQAVVEVRAALKLVDRVQFDKALRATTVYSQGRERSKTTIIAAVHGARRAQAVLARRIAERGGPALRWHTCLYQPHEFIAAVADPTPFNDLIAERVARHAQLSELVPPFIVDGRQPPPAQWERRAAAGPPAAPGDVFHGIAGCPGVARGRARVVLDAAYPGDLGPGDVLVAPITDPSWTPLFLAADAVVVDVGATMSHAVIVSRELGIPCVVSAVGATRRIPDGATIEVDGNRGTVTVLEVPAAQPS